MAVRIAMGNMLVLRVIRCFFKGGGDGRGRGVMVLMVGGSGGGDGVMVGG